MLSIAIIGDYMLFSLWVALYIAVILYGARVSDRETRFLYWNLLHIVRIWRPSSIRFSRARCRNDISCQRARWGSDTEIELIFGEETWIFAVRRAVMKGSTVGRASAFLLCLDSSLGKENTVSERAWGGSIGSQDTSNIISPVSGWWSIEYQTTASM
jgi:hypothetical protein